MSQRILVIGATGLLQQVGERGDPSEANAILGAPQITLERWLQAQGRRVGSRRLREAG